MTHKSFEPRFLLKGAKNVAQRVLIFQVVLEILGDAFVQMNAGMAPHVVSLARVGKEVGLGAGLNAEVKKWLQIETTGKRE